MAMSQEVEKVQNFLDPLGDLDFFEFWKKWKFDDPLPPLGPKLGKICNKENHGETHKFKTPKIAWKSL